MAGILYLNGSLFIDLIKKIFRQPATETVHFPITCIAGMAFTTFLNRPLPSYAINLIANIIVFAIAALYFAFRRHTLSQQWSSFRAQIKAFLIHSDPVLCFLFTISFCF